MKIKAKLKDDVVSVKVLIKHPNLTYDQAKKKGKEANYITHISGKSKWQSCIWYEFKSIFIKKSTY